MAQVHVLLVGLEPSTVDLSDPATADILGSSPAAIQAGLDRAIAILRRLGYETDFCGIDEGRTAPEVLLRMMRAKRYNCIVFSASIRLVPRRSRLFERLVNLAQVTKPDTVILFDTGAADTVETVRRWFPSSDEG